MPSQIRRQDQAGEGTRPFAPLGLDADVTHTRNPSGGGYFLRINGFDRLLNTSLRQYPALNFGMPNTQ